MTKEQDTEFKEFPIEEVRVESSGYIVAKLDGGWLGIGQKDGLPVMPEVGMIIRTYGRGLGYAVRGIDINGVEIRYQTPEQERQENERYLKDQYEKKRADFEANREKMDAAYEALPEIFRKRIEKFRSNNPEFRWEYEPYEMFCCEEAVKMANRSFEAVDRGEFAGEVAEFWGGRLWKSAYPEMTERIEDPVLGWLYWANALNTAAYDYEWQRHQRVLGTSDGHSGNTYGCAFRLAVWYIAANGEAIVKSHGALAPLVGSEEYGFVPRAS